MTGWSLFVVGFAAGLCAVYGLIKLVARLREDDAARAQRREVSQSRAALHRARSHFVLIMDGSDVRASSIARRAVKEIDGYFKEARKDQANG